MSKNLNPIHIDQKKKRKPEYIRLCTGLKQLGPSSLTRCPNYFGYPLREVLVAIDNALGQMTLQKQMEYLDEIQSDTALDFLRKTIDLIDPPPPTEDESTAPIFEKTVESTVESTKPSKDLKALQDKDSSNLEPVEPVSYVIIKTNLIEGDGQSTVKSTVKSTLNSTSPKPLQIETYREGPNVLERQEPLETDDIQDIKKSYTVQPEEISSSNEDTSPPEPLSEPLAEGTDQPSATAESTQNALDSELLQEQEKIVLQQIFRQWRAIALESSTQPWDIPVQIDRLYKSGFQNALETYTFYNYLSLLEGRVHEIGGNAFLVLIDQGDNRLNVSINERMVSALTFSYEAQKRRVPDVRTPPSMWSKTNTSSPQVQAPISPMPVPPQQGRLGQFVSRLIR